MELASASTQPDYSDSDGIGRKTSTGLKVRHYFHFQGTDGKRQPSHAASVTRICDRGAAIAPPTRPETLTIIDLARVLTMPSSFHPQQGNGLSQKELQNSRGRVWSLWFLWHRPANARRDRTCGAFDAVVVYRDLRLLHKRCEPMSVENSHHPNFSRVYRGDRLCLLSKTFRCVLICSA